MSMFYSPVLRRINLSYLKRAGCFYLDSFFDYKKVPNDQTHWRPIKLGELSNWCLTQDKSTKFRVLKFRQRLSCRKFNRRTIEIYYPCNFLLVADFVFQMVDDFFTEWSFDFVLLLSKLQQVFRLIGYVIDQLAFCWL